MARFSISTTVLMSISLLILVACSNKRVRHYRIITQQYIDSLDSAGLNRKPDTTDNWQLPLATERILEEQVPARYFETLMHYFTDTLANEEIERFGNILIISGPYAFGYMSSSFKINNKPFYFISPPYYQLYIKKGRHIYFIYHNYPTISNGRSGLSGDTLTITLFEYFPTESAWEPYYKDKKSLVFRTIYVADSLSPQWVEIKRERMK